MRASPPSRVADEESISRFTVREWSAILRQTSDLSFFADKPVTDLVGFVLPDDDDPRQHVLCDTVRGDVLCGRRSAPRCSHPPAELGVDVRARQLGEHLGQLREQPEFEQVLQPVVVIPDTVEPVEQPREPYLF